MRDAIIGILALHNVGMGEVPSDVSMVPPELPIEIGTRWTCADAQSVAEVGLPADRAALRAFVVDKWQAAERRYGPALADALAQVDDASLVRQTVQSCAVTARTTRFSRIVDAMIEATAREHRPDGP